MKIVIFASLIFCFCACKTPRAITAGDPVNANIGFGYQPLDPLPISLKSNGTDVKISDKKKEILSVLSDETMRLAVGERTASGGISYGPAKIGYEGNSYIIIIDYIKFSTINHLYKYTIADNKSIKFYPLADNNDPAGKPLTQSSFPVYVGIGLRLTATITVNSGKVDLGNLFAIGAAAEAKKVTGTMTVQTLGITGDKITSLIPLPGEVSSTSIQNAILALGTIKSKMYDNETMISPRVVGFYNTSGGGSQTVYDFISYMMIGLPILNL